MKVKFQPALFQPYSVYPCVALRGIQAWLSVVHGKLHEMYKFHAMRKRVPRKRYSHVSQYGGWSLLCVTLWAVLVYCQIHFHDVVVRGRYFTDSSPALVGSSSRFHCIQFCHLFKELRPTLFAVHRAGISWYLLLLLASDISPNPGTIRYPCTVCTRSVRSNQMALQCDCCQLWTSVVLVL